jgi:LysR family hydrogen peroxide-inducible transcriptional activator
MTITQIQYLVAVYRQKSFSAAAKICGVTQPTLSMQIQKLEEELGILIFDRSKKPMLTTEIGEIIVSQGLELLAVSKKITDAVLDFKGELAGELRVAIIPTIAPYLTPFFLPEIVKDPKISIKIEERKTEDIVKSLERDEIDVGILALSGQFSGIIETPIYSEKMLVYCSPGHSLLNKTTLEPEDLEGKDIWMLNQGHCWRNQALKACETLNLTFDKNLSYESGSLDTLIRMVELHKGYTLIPEMCTHYFNEDQMENVRYFNQSQPGRTVGIAVKHTFLKQKLIQHLKDSIIKSVPKRLIDNSVQNIDIY